MIKVAKTHERACQEYQIHKQTHSMAPPVTTPILCYKQVLYQSLFSKVIKKVYLTCLLFLLGKLTPPYQVLDVYIQLSCGLVFGLFDVCKVFIPGLPVTGALLEAVGKSLEHCLCIHPFVFCHLVLPGCPSLRCLFATIEQDVDDLCFLGSGGNHNVLLQPLPEEGPCCKLVLSIPVHPGKHVWWYVSCHPGWLLIVQL